MMPQSSTPEAPTEASMHRRSRFGVARSKQLVAVTACHCPAWRYMSRHGGRAIDESSDRNVFLSFLNSLSLLVNKLPSAFALRVFELHPPPLFHSATSARKSSVCRAFFCPHLRMARQAIQVMKYLHCQGIWSTTAGEPRVTTRLTQLEHGAMRRAGHGAAETFVESEFPAC